MMDAVQVHWTLYTVIITRLFLRIRHAKIAYISLQIFLKYIIRSLKLAKL